MTLIYHDTQSGVTLKERGGKIVLPSGQTILCKGANPNPELGLYRYVEEGPKRPKPSMRIETATSIKGASYVVSRSEVADSNFDLDAFKAQKILALKTQAGAIILEKFPDWKQRNMNMRVTEFQEIRIEGIALTAEEQAESNVLKLAANWIKLVRETSNSVEVEILALKTADEVSAFVPQWPEFVVG
ncbi:MAG: hypothetical protein OQK35_01755 [Alphaproteobacteria bacterium]|nr:hypothetical protein [Alphaproteobacteria bacterium]